MFKNKIVFKNKLDVLLKYVVFYSVFIFFVVFNVSNNILLKSIPNFSLPMIFFTFIWLHNKNIFYPPINLLLLGLIIDAYNFLPLFLTSFTLLVSYKLTLLVKKFLVNDNYIMYLIRDCVIFMVLFFVLRWFILSYYNENFYPFFSIVFDVILNIIYCVFTYVFFNKFLRNV